MAINDLTLFEETLTYYGEGGANQIDFETDTFNMSLIISTTTPTAADAGPAYSGGTTNFNGAAEPGTAGNYTAGGTVLASPSWSEDAGVITFNATDPAVWSQAGANPTDVRWALIYDDTTTIKHGIAFIDLGSVFDMSTGDLTITLAAGGILQLSIQASV